MYSMLIAVGSLTLIGLTLGTILGAAARKFAVKEDPLEEELKASKKELEKFGVNWGGL